jgi:hypothetical protein
MEFETVKYPREQLEEFVGAVELLGPKVDGICDQFIALVKAHGGESAVEKIARLCGEEDVMGAVASVWPEGPGVAAQLCATALGAKTPEEIEKVWTLTRPSTCFIWNATWDALAEKFVTTGKASADEP